MIIVFEGMPGSGKTTQIALLKEYLESKGYEVVVSEAGKDNKLTDFVRRLALKLEFNSSERAFMFWIMRLLHAIFLDLKLDSLNGKEIVLVDRCWGSLIANASVELKKYFNDDFWDALGKELGQKIDCTILLDVSRKNSLKRKSSFTAENHPVYFRAVRKKFFELAKKHGWQIVNANRETARIGKDIREIISSKFI